MRGRPNRAARVCPSRQRRLPALVVDHGRACDIDPSDVVHRNFNSWLGNGMGNRYQQVPGQVDRLWVLDVDGQRLVIDATYSSDTVQADRDELESVVASLLFAAP
jgi:hypothetical protein